MYKDEYGRSWEGPHPFDTAEILRLGRKLSSPGLYQILYMKEPVYIGVSSASIYERLKSHAKGTGNDMASRRVGAKDYEFVYWFCDGTTARQIESHITVQNKPGFNHKTEYIHYILSISVH